MNGAGSVIIEGTGEAGTFVVRLDPPDDKWPQETFTEHRKAMGYAGGIRLVTGRRKVDLAGAG